MAFYDDEISVKQYLDMAEGYDGKALVERFKNYLPAGSRVLELGMGPGKDLDLLKESYRVVGSDNSQVFLDLYAKEHAQAELQLLDAVTIDSNDKYDGIYSNKVLQHLTTEELEKSIQRQSQLLEPNGFVCHSFWYGEGVEVYDGLRFTYYQEEDLLKLFRKYFDVVLLERYDEASAEDSMVLIGKLGVLA